MQVTTAATLDKRRKRKKTDTFPVVIRVTFNRIPNSYPIGVGLSEGDFKKLSAPRVGENLAQIRAKIAKEHDRAKEIIGRLKPFSFQDFRREFYRETPAFALEKKEKGNGLPNGLPVLTGEISTENQCRESKKIVHQVREIPEPEGFTFASHTKRYGTRKFPRIRSNVNFQELGPLAENFGDYIRELEKENRVGTSEGYFTTLMSLLKFRPGLRMEDITKDFLLEYDAWMKELGKSETTIGMYLRNVRALFNIAVDDGLISKDLYPFGKGRKKYQIPTGRNIKKALDLTQIKLLYDYSPKARNPNVLLGRDMWFFLFFGNGMNPKDLAFLKYKNIDGDYIRFIREKTKNTTKNDPQKITIALNDDMRGTIKKWGNLDKTPENYIFPVIKPGLSAHRQKELIQLFIKGINKWIGFIASEQGIKEKVRCMEARHSYSTILKRAGASYEFIREALGHMSLKTTQNYFAGYEDKTIQEVSVKLLAFKDLPTIAPPTESKAI